MLKAVGRNVLRKEGADKVTGAARYIDDLAFPGLLHARTIRSTIPAGEIADIRFNFDTDGLHDRRLPRHPRPERRRADRRRSAVPRRARRSGTSPSRSCCWRTRIASGCWRADVADRLPRRRTPNYDPEASPTSFKTIAHRQGRRRRAASPRPTSIVEGEYRIGHQEQLYIEPNGVIAVPETTAAITVYGSMQCPYYVHRALTVLLGLPDEQVRVVQTETGGGFGGKEEYPSMIAGHAALLALQGAAGR